MNDTRALDQFIENLDRIPWFKRLGQPSIRDNEVFRIYSWQTWPGPEDPGSELQSAYHMQWRNELFQSGMIPENDPLTDLWKQIYSKVFELARVNVPYYDEEDAWYGPNAAVGDASWAAALVACKLKTHSFLLEHLGPFSQCTIENEWSWLAEGHWPCSYFWSGGYTDLDAVERIGGPRRLIVY